MKTNENATFEFVFLQGVVYKKAKYTKSSPKIWFENVFKINYLLIN